MRLLAAGLFAILTSLPCAARAEAYRVDLIVFRFLGAAEELGSAPTAPNLSGAVELSDAKGLRTAGITLLPDEQFGLTDEWARLKSSSQFRPLTRLAWTQDQPPAERGPSLRIKAGTAYTVTDPNNFSSRSVSEVEGSVALLLGRFLHLDADLNYTQVDSSGVRSWRLRERRRLKRDELNHLDSPRLGLLVRVTKTGS
jgi:hypothetical protein